MNTLGNNIHLDSASNEARINFVERINQKHADAILITGDIATGTTIIDELTWLNAEMNPPCYFVLGNHDYYGASIAMVREQIAQWSQTTPSVVWLDEAQPVQLSGDSSLEMVDGRCRNGNFRDAYRLNVIG